MRLPCGCSCEARPTAYDGSMANGLTYQRTTTTPEATKQLAATLAPYLHAGDTIVLTGDLGAGKTQFVQGVAAALGVRAAVTSPTFNILLEYHDGACRCTTTTCTGWMRAGSWRTSTTTAPSTATETERPSWNGPRSSPRTCPTTIWRSPSQPTATAHGRIVAHSFGSRSRQLLCVWANDSKSRLGKCQL